MFNLIPNAINLREVMDENYLILSKLLFIMYYDK